MTNFRLSDFHGSKEAELAAADKWVQENQSLLREAGIDSRSLSTKRLFGDREVEFVMPSRNERRKENKFEALFADFKKIVADVESAKLNYTADFVSAAQKMIATIEAGDLIYYANEALLLAFARTWGIDLIKFYVSDSCERAINSRLQFAQESDYAGTQETYETYRFELGWSDWTKESGRVPAQSEVALKIEALLPSVYEDAKLIIDNDARGLCSATLHPLAAIMIARFLMKENLDAIRVADDEQVGITSDFEPEIETTRGATSNCPPEVYINFGKNLHTTWLGYFGDNLYNVYRPSLSMNNLHSYIRAVGYHWAIFWKIFADTRGLKEYQIPAGTPLPDEVRLALLREACEYLPVQVFPNFIEMRGMGFYSEQVKPPASVMTMR